MTRKRIDRDESAFAHAEDTLELAAVLDYIASKCQNDRARGAIRSLRPTTDRSLIEERILEIEEAREYLAVEGRLPIADTASQALIERAETSHDVISPQGLLDVASVEREVLALRRRFAKEDRYSLLQPIVLQLIAHEALIESIDRAIDRDGSLRDTASSKLKALRKSTRRAREDVRRYADHLSKKLGSDEYTTFAGNRHMLVIPREKCRKKEGIIHASSHSGGSVYFEPMGLVERNNSLEEIIHEERAEEARIIADLTARVVNVADELRANIAIWEQLDVLSAKSVFASEFECVNPAVSDDGALNLVDARHPLLALSLREKGRSGDLVPLDLRLDRSSRVLVITGPNAGGKTVTLKTVGLLVLMFQCGLPIPCAEGAEVSIFHKVHADIGDEQSIATSLSTFTSHLGHLDGMCKAADRETLCLIDEIGDGTDPDEGAALAIAAIERLLECGAAVVATTHYGKVKSFALQTDGVSNASMVFDDDNDMPLYRLLQGTAGRSRGIETARRLGFCPPVVERAESMIGAETFRLEKLLADLESSNLAIERERAALLDQSEALKKLIESYDEKERDLREFKQTHREQAMRDAQELVVKARGEIESIVKGIRESKADKEHVRQGHRQLKRMLDESHVDRKPKKATDPKPGDLVSLSPSGEPNGRVLSVDRKKATVEIRGKKITVEKQNLYIIKGDESEPEQSVGIQVDVEPLRETSLDIRGHDREDALLAIDHFIDRAAMNAVSEVKIIHGIGEGVLKRAVVTHLQGDTRVASIRGGSLSEGGAGVSFIKLK